MTNARISSLKKVIKWRFDKSKQHKIGKYSNMNEMKFNNGYEEDSNDKKIFAQFHLNIF